MAFRLILFVVFPLLSVLAGIFVSRDVLHEMSKAEFIEKGASTLHIDTETPIEIPPLVQEDGIADAPTVKAFALIKFSASAKAALADDSFSSQVRIESASVVPTCPEGISAIEEGLFTLSQYKRGRADRYIVDTTREVCVPLISTIVDSQKIRKDLTAQLVQHTDAVRHSLTWFSRPAVQIDRLKLQHGPQTWHLYGLAVATALCDNENCDSVQGLAAVEFSAYANMPASVDVSPPRLTVPPISRPAEQDAGIEFETFLDITPRPETN